MAASLAIPAGEQQQQQLRAVRSVGSLRTPHTSDANAIDNYGLRHQHSLSPPDLSFSRSTLLSDHEADFMSRGVGGSQTLSSNNGDSWNSRASSNRNGGGLSRNRVRLDSVFGPSLPGFPYLNSAAAATSAGFGKDVRTRASWSDRSATASGSMRSNSAAARDSSGTGHTTASADADTSCSGGSNSSDDVDLDLSWDIDVLRARQHAEQVKAAQANPSKGKAAHVGIDIRSSIDLPNEESEEYRRYRLAGKKRMSRSAVELRQNAPPAQRPRHQQPYQDSSVNSARSDPGRLSAAGWAQPHAVGSSGIAGTAGNPEELGWSYAASPPLSPNELVTFAEQTQRNSSFMSTSLSDSGRTSKLLRKRRPSFPLKLLLDKAMRNSPVSSPSDATMSSFGSPTPTQSDPSGIDRRDTLLSTSPETSNWSGPKSPDEIPTPRTGDFNRLSHFSTSMNGNPDAEGDTLRQQAFEVIPPQAKEHTVENTKPTHTRQSSSIFRFPFTSLLSSFRPATPQPSTTPSTITPVQEVPNARAGSPGSSETHATPSEENHSQESHSAEGASSQESGQTSSPPRLGATSRARISDSIMRPGPNKGKGRLTGLGLHMVESGRNRQSSMPVISFSTPSEETHGQAEHSSQEAVEVLQAPTPASAPASAVHFAPRSPILLSPRSPRIGQMAQPQDQTIQMQDKPQRRPRQMLAKHTGMDLRGKIDRMRPSQLLFLAAFLLGPWCFVIGGWSLRAKDGEYIYHKGTRCRCPPTQESCECHAEIYHQVRLLGGQQQLQANSNLQTQKMDRFVLANRVASLFCGSASLVLAVTALIVASRAW